MCLCVCCVHVCMCVYVHMYVGMYQRACMEARGDFNCLTLSISAVSFIQWVTISLNEPARGWQPACPSDPPVSTQSPPISAPVSVCKHTIKHGFLHGLHLSSKHLTHWANCLVPGYFIHINLILSKRKSTFANSFWLHTTFHWRSSVRVSPAGFVTTQTGPGWTQTLDLLESIQSNIRKSLKVYFLVVVLHCILCICM